MKRKLLIFHPALAPYRVDFFNYLSDNFETFFYFSYDNVNNQKFDQEKLRSKCNFKVNVLRNGFELTGRAIRWGIIKIIRSQSPDIVLCSEYSQVTIIVLLYKKLTRSNFKVYTCADDSIDLSIRRKGIRKWVRGWAANHLDGVLLPTPEVGKWFHKFVNKNIPVMELPVASLNKRFREELLLSIPLAEKKLSENKLIGRKVYLFVGRLVDVKNLELLFRAFAEIDLKNKVLVIVGDGELKEKLHNLAIELSLKGHIIFTGRLEGLELISWYNIAGYFILPSYQETFGAVVNEALLAGCKVICSRLAGAAELINTDNGVLFDPYDQNELTRILEHVGRNMKGAMLPIQLRDDRMPFNMEDKFNDIMNNI